MSWNGRASETDARHRPRHRGHPAGRQRRRSAQGRRRLLRRAQRAHGRGRRRPARRAPRLRRNGLMTATTEHPKTDATLDELCINTIRTLAMDAVQKANSGHPGTPMALAPIAYVLYTRIMRHAPEHPDWPNRDRFVLSAGHASMLLYAILHLTGYGISLEAIKNFRQLNSPAAGHPEYRHAPGIEATTGPLGQGISMCTGLALGERMLNARLGDDVIDHHTFTIASDGDMQEGISGEAGSLAGHLKLGRLVAFYDDNHISIEGDTAVSFSEDVGKRYEAYGWHVQ